MGLGTGIGVGLRGARRAAAAAYTPAADATVGLWFDAVGAGVADNDTVATWTDKSANAVAVSQVSGSGPKYRTGRLNGLPAVVGNAGSMYLHNTTYTGLNGLNKATFYFLVKPGQSSNQIAFSPANYAGHLQYDGNLYARQSFPGGDVSGLFSMLRQTPQLIEVVYDGTLTGNANRWKVYCKGAQKTLTFAGTIAATFGTATGLDIGKVWGFATGYWDGDLYEMMVFRGVAHTPEERAARRAYLESKWLATTKPKVLCVGDSLTAGFGMQDGVNPYPNRLHASLGTSTWDMENIGATGRTLDNMLSTVNNDCIFKRFEYRPRDAVILWGGTNNLPDSNETAPATPSPAATVYGWNKAYCQAAIAAGYEVYSLTMLQRQDRATTPWNVSCENGRLVYNGLLANLPADVPGVHLVDVAADARLQNCLNATYFYGDAVHLSAAGYQVVAGLVQAAMGL